MAPPDSCALCNSSETNATTKELQSTADGSVVAHYNCMLYSPMVIMKDSQEDVEGFDFKIESVVGEIKRGKELRCNFCKRSGATVGCNVRSCKRTYHYPCVEKAKGSSREYVIYCFEHKTKKTMNGSKVVKRGRKRKRFRKMDDKPRKKSIKRRHINNFDLQNMQINEQPKAKIILYIQSSFIEVEENEDPLPSTSGQQPSMSSGSSSEESDSILSPKPKVTAVFSLSGLPKTKKKYSSDRKPNEKLEQILQTMSSQDKAALSEVYSDLGGSHQNLSLDTTSPVDNQNDAEDALNTDVTDISTYSDSDDTDKTPERLPYNVHVTPSRFSTKEHVTEEQPESSPEEEIPDKASASVAKRKRPTINDVVSKLSDKLPAKPSSSSIVDRPRMSTVDAPLCSDDSTDTSDTLPGCVNGTMWPTMQPLTLVTDNSMGYAAGLSNDIQLPTPQIHSTNSKEMLFSQPINCADTSKSTRPHTSVTCFVDMCDDEQPDDDLGRQRTSETHPSWSRPVTEPQSPFFRPLPLKKDGNKTEMSTGGSAVSLENMEIDVSASPLSSREIPSVEFPRNVKTLQSEKGEKKRTISSIVSAEQISTISRNLITGSLSQRFKSIVPRILSIRNSPKGNAKKDLEQRREGDVISDRSENPSTSNQAESASVGNNLPEALENQENSDGSVREEYPERRKSTTSKRKRSEDVEEPLPDVNLQQTHTNFNMSTKDNHMDQSTEDSEMIGLTVGREDAEKFFAACNVQDYIQTISTKALQYRIILLSEKEVNLFWTIKSLYSYRDSKLTPRGLRVYLDISQFYDDPVFVQEWERLHLQHSLNLMLLVLQRTECEYTHVKEELNKALAELKNRLAEAQYLTFMKKVEKKIKPVQAEIKERKRDNFLRDKQDFDSGLIFNWNLQKPRHQRSMQNMDYWATDSDSSQAEEISTGGTSRDISNKVSIDMEANSLDNKHTKVAQEAEKEV